MMNLSKQTFQFLKQLAQNNNRAWFTENKTTFKKQEAEVKAFFAAVHQQLAETDNIESHKLMRIYRDVRFSKDKTPYKPRFAGSFKRATLQLRGGYFINIEPGNSLVGGGFYGPNPDDLMRIRKEFEIDDSEIREIISAPKFTKLFGTLQGEEVKTAPRGFDKNHPAIDLIKKKQFYVMRSFTDAEVIAPQFINEVITTFIALRPFFDYMSDVLTTNLNGESIIEE